MSTLQTLAPTNSFDPAAVTGRVTVPLSVGFSWSFFGWVGYAACQWVILSVTAKLGTSALVGQFAFATALAGPVFMLTNLQLRGVQSTDALNHYSFADYLTLRMIGSALALFTIGVLCPFLKLGSSAIYVVLLVAGFKTLESLGDVAAGLMQKFEMLDSVAISLLLRGGASCLVFATAFAAWHSLPLALMLWAIAAAATIATYDYRVAHRLASLEGGFRCAFDRQRIQALAMTCLPLGLVSAISALNANIPRYTVERVLGVGDLGVFASIAYPVTAATIVANSLGQSALARLSRHFADQRIEDFKRVTLKLVACGVALTVCGLAAVMLVGNQLLSLLYTPEYGKQGHLFLVLALAAGLNCIASFLVYALTAARQFRIQIPITLACVLTTFAASAFLVPRIRLMGAAVALVISAGLQIALCGGTLTRTVTRAARSRGN